MTVDDLVLTAERAAQIVRKMADELHEAGLEAQAQLLVNVAEALDRATKEALAAPEETPPSGLYKVLDELEHPTPVARRLANRLRRGRSLVRQLLAAAEITGDAELIAEAQRWLDDVKKD